MKKTILLLVFMLLVMSLGVIALADENAANPSTQTQVSAEVTSTTPPEVMTVDQLGNGKADTVAKSVYAFREGYITALTDSTIQLKVPKGKKAEKKDYDKFTFTFNSDTKLVRNVFGKVSLVKLTDLKVGKFVRVEFNKETHQAIRIALRPDQAVKEKLVIDKAKMKAEKEKLKAAEKKLKIEKEKAKLKLKKMKEKVKKNIAKEKGKLKNNKNINKQSKE